MTNLQFTQLLAHIDSKIEETVEAVVKKYFITDKDMSISEFAEKIKWTEDYVRHKLNEIPHYKVGKKNMIPYEDAIRYIERHTQLPTYR